jgi:hypothetical protein
VILPKERDPRFITIRRGGTLTDADHQLLGLWAAACAEHVLPLFEAEQPSDPRPREAIEQIRAWARRPGMPRSLPVRRRWWRMWPRMSSVPRRTRSRPSGRRRLRMRTPAERSAVGSVSSFRRRFVSWSWMTSGCATTSAGRSSNADATIVGGLEWVGAFEVKSPRPAPYRPHLPHPIAYWLYVVGDVALDARPTNPAGGEAVTDVLTLPPAEAVDYLTVFDDGQLTDVLRLAIAMGHI